jgi:hypothetical protein
MWDGDVLIILNLLTSNMKFSHVFNLKLSSILPCLQARSHLIFSYAATFLHANQPDLGL